MPTLLRTATIVIACAPVWALVGPAPTATAAQPWSDPQTISTASANGTATALAQTSDGTLVALTRDAAGSLRRSTRQPGADWVPDGVFAEPYSLTIEYVDAVAVTGDGAAWLVYQPEDEDSDDVRIVRWDADGTSEVMGRIQNPFTIVGLSVDAEGDVLVTYGERGGEPLAAVYGNVADGLADLDVPTWTGDQRPHAWVLGPDDDVMLVSRFGRELRSADVGPDGDGRTRTVRRPGAGLTGQVAAAIAPSGVQYVAWTTSVKGDPKEVRVARRTTRGAWKPGRLVDQRGGSSRAQQSLALHTTSGGVYAAWSQPGKSGSQIRGALVRPGRPAVVGAVAEPRDVGTLGGRRLALDVSEGGRLLVGWTRVVGSTRQVAVALGRVRGELVVTRLFGVASVQAPVVLLRAADQTTVAGSSASSTSSGLVVTSASTD